VLVHDAQPGNLLVAAEADPFAGVELPDQVGCRSAVVADVFPAAGLCRLQAGLTQVALQGAGTGQVLLALLGQDDAHVGRAPAGMLAAAVEHGTGVLRRAAAVVVVGQQGGIWLGEAAHESADGARGQAQSGGDGRDAVALALEFEQTLA
jgi:hypothetical protein